MSAECHNRPFVARRQPTPLTRASRAFAACVVVAAAVLWLSGQGFTSGVSGAAGSATSGVSGYRVSDVRYTYSADYRTVTRIEFELDGPASHISVALSSRSSRRTSCRAAASVGSTYAVSCDVAVPTAEQDVFSVAAHS